MRLVRLLTQTISLKKHCAAGASIQYARDLTSEHGGLAVVGAGKALSWLINVMEGKTPPTKCSANNVISSLLDPSTLTVIPKVLVDALLDFVGKSIGPTLFG